MSQLVPPTDTFLGNLRMREVYFHYEGPRIFAATSEIGTLFFAFIVSEDDELNTETYLYLPVSQPRLNAMRSHGISLRKAVLEPEDGILVEITADYGHDTPRNNARYVRPADIPADWLPAQDAYLSLPTVTRPDFEPDLLATESASENRPLFAVEVDPPASLRTEYPLKPFGRIAIAIQETVDALAQEASGQGISARGAIRGDIVEQVEMMFLENQAASFVFVLGPGSEDALFRTGLLEESLERLTALLSAGNGEPQALQGLISQYGSRSISKYRNLLDAFSQDGTGVHTYLMTPTGGRLEASLGLGRLRASLDLLNHSSPTSTAIELDEVTLVGVNLRTGVFELRDNREGSKYVGKVTVSGRVAIEGLPTGDNYVYKASLLSQVEYSSATDEEKTAYKLDDIAGLDQGE